MPGGDGTGPMGLGPMTGRAAGYCAGYGMPGYMNPYGGRRVHPGLAYHPAVPGFGAVAFPARPAFAYGAFPRRGLGMAWGRGGGFGLGMAWRRGGGRGFGRGWARW